MRRFLLLLMLFTSCSSEEIEPIQEPIENNVNIWTDGVIPFTFTDNVSQEHKDIILQAFLIYESFADVQYVEYEVSDLINLENGFLIKYTGSVNNSVFPIGMPQKGVGSHIAEWRVSDIKYLTLGVALHELGHNLGRPHEMQLANVSESMIINYENISDGWKANFELKEVIFSTKPDPLSNMNYSSFDASKNGEPTIIRLDGSTFNRSNELTELDKLKYIELYGKVTF